MVLLARYHSDHWRGARALFTPRAGVTLGSPFPDGRVPLRRHASAARGQPAWSIRTVMSDTAASADTASLVRSRRPDLHWSPPLQFPAADDVARQEIARLISDGRASTVVDPLADIADELYDCRRVGPLHDQQARSLFQRRILDGAETFGVWVFFPWSRNLVRYPDVEDHRSLRTFRNRDLITAPEQQTLYRARIAVFGLSVGSNIVEQLIQLGIGGAYLIADYDRVRPSNLNRIRATMHHVGTTKLDLLACKMSEIDPFIEQVHLPEGYTPDSTTELEHFHPTLLIEEVDDLVTKARLRQWARDSHTALITVGDIGERSVIDVERHDLGPVRPFNGRVKQEVFDRLVAGQLTAAEERRVLVNIVGPRNLTVRLVNSALRVGSDLAGIPQLGSAASAGAAVASVAVRAIIGQEALRSGSYVLSPRHTLRLGRQSRLRDVIRSIRTLSREFRQP